MSVRAGLLLLLLGSFGCGKAVTSEPLSGRSGGYEIECARKAECVARAEQVCAGRYEVVSAWTQPALLPELPAPDPLLPLRALSPPANSRRHVTSSNTGPAISDPALVSRLEVHCVN